MGTDGDVQGEDYTDVAVRMSSARAEPVYGGERHGHGWDQERHTCHSNFTLPWSKMSFKKYTFN